MYNYLGMIRELGFDYDISNIINSYLLDDKRNQIINSSILKLHCDYEYDKFENKNKYFIENGIKSKDLFFGQWFYYEHKLIWKYCCKIQDNIYHRIPIYTHDISLYNFICKNNDIGDYHNEALHDLFEYEFKDLLFKLWNKEGYKNYDIIINIKNGKFLMLWDSIKNNFTFL